MIGGMRALIFLAVFVWMSVLSWGRVSDILTDFGKEFYYPAAMLGGEVLCRDLFLMYTPMSYFVNAALFKVFGASLNTLFAASHLNALIILVMVYLISRLFNSAALSYVIAAFVMFIGVFSLTSGSFTVGYSFGLVYAFSMVLVSVYFFLRQNFLLAFLFAGIALSCKIDFIFYAAFLVLYVAFKNREQLKSAAVMLIAPVIALACLLVSGASFADIANNFAMLNVHCNTESFKTLYANSTGLVLNSDKIKSILYWFFVSAGVFGVLAASIYSLFKYKAARIIILALMFAAFEYTHFDFTDLKVFCWLPLFVLAGLVVQTFIRKKNPQLYLLGICSVLVGYKSLFWLYLDNYGTVAFALYFIYLVTVLYNYVPLNPKVWQKTCMIIFCYFIVLYLYFNVNPVGWVGHRVETPKGTLRVQADQAPAYRQVIDYIQNNMPKDAYFLVMREGVIFNFLTDRKTSNIYYNLSPIMVEMLGQDNIISGLRADLPDYIFVTSYISVEYNLGMFGDDYAGGIMDFINENYDKKQRFSGEEDEFFIDMYIRRKR